MLQKMTPPIMASTETSLAPPGRTVRRLPTATPRSVLLLCGVISSALYLATDIAGGLSYPGYSFGSQAIERIDVYASLVWIAAFAIALLREPL
jgi:hypothetical protein